MRSADDALKELSDPYVSDDLLAKRYGLNRQQIVAGRACLRAMGCHVPLKRRLYKHPDVELLARWTRTEIWNAMKDMGYSRHKIIRTIR